MAEPATPSYRLKLPCSDEREFRDKFLQKYVTRGVFVPSERPKPIGTRLKLKLEIRNGVVLVSGDGMVTSCTQPGGATKPGMTVRLTALHPESIQFDLSPGGGAPATTPGPAPTPHAMPPKAPTASAPAPAGTLAARPPPPAAPPSPPLHASAPPPPPPTPPPPPLPAPHAVEHEDFFNLDDEPMDAAATAAAILDDGVTAFTDPAIPVPRELLEMETEAPEPSPAAPLPPSQPHRPRPGRTLVVAAAVGLTVVAGIVAATTVVASRSGRAAREVTARVDELLRLSDLHLLEGRLTDARGDSALDHLLEAKSIAPGDERVVTRLKLLADKFEQLGDRAFGRKNLREAAVHYKATLLADSTRTKARERLDEISPSDIGTLPGR